MARNGMDSGIRWWLIAVVVAALVWGAGVEPATACPTCKVALASHDPAAGDIVRGYFWSILFMMSMPFMILGSFSGYMYLEVRRARSQRAAAGQGGGETDGGANAEAALAQAEGNSCDATRRSGQ